MVEQVETDRVWLVYRQRDQSGKWQNMRYPVYLDRTPCTFGGSRAWWICPGVCCGRCVAVLYGGSVFACRHCHKLGYRSQLETDGDLAARRAGKIRDRLGWEPGILNGTGSKPKGMHWRTFYRLTYQHDEQAYKVLAGLASRFGIR